MFFISLIFLVSNKWIRETGQEFNRPCQLIADAEV